MEDLKEISKLILLQVQHNSDCGKEDKVTTEEIEDIIKRRVLGIKNNCIHPCPIMVIHYEECHNFITHIESSEMN